MAELSRAEYVQLGKMWFELRDFLYEHNMSATLTAMEALVYISSVEAKGSTDPVDDALTAMVRDIDGDGANKAIQNLENMKNAVKRKMT